MNFALDRTETLVVPLLAAVVATFSYWRGRWAASQSPHAREVLERVIKEYKDEQNAKESRHMAKVEKSFRKAVGRKISSVAHITHIKEDVVTCHPEHYEISVNCVVVYGIPNNGRWRFYKNIKRLGWPDIRKVLMDAEQG